MARMDTPAVAGLTVAVVALSLNAFDCALPPLYEVGAAPADPSRVSLARTHVKNAAIVSLALGIGAAAVCKSPMPLIAVVAAVGWMAWQYDSAARRPGQ